jgi:hypothetical protein
MVVRGWRAGDDLDIAQVYPGIEHRGEEGVPGHVRMRSGNPDSGHLSEPPQPAGGGMAVHPGATTADQDRRSGAACSRLIDGPADRRRQRDQGNLAATTTYAQDPVTVFFA